MPNGGIVTIRTADAATSQGREIGTEGLTGKFVQIDVSDTGTGMSGRRAPPVFDPFFTTRGRCGRVPASVLSQSLWTGAAMGGVIKIELNWSWH